MNAFATSPPLSTSFPMKPPSGLLAVLLFGILSSPLLANTLSRETEVERHLEIGVEHALFASLWVEVYDAQDRLVGAWYAPWDGDCEVIEGVAPAWMEQLLLEGWSGFGIELPEPGLYRVVVSSLDDVWTIELVTAF